jgi:glycosyltransferase involved in cell wall biosynthesis
MRIGIIAPPWIPVPPPAYGGTEAVVDGLARGLSTLGHEVVLAAAAESTCPVVRFPRAEQLSTPILGDWGQERRHAVAAYSAFADIGVDVVHDHTITGPGHPSRPARMPVVVTVHGPFTPEARRLYGSLPPDVALVAISRHQASTAGAVPIARVIHHGIDATAIPTGAGQGGYLLFLGRMIREKGVHRAIQIARMAGIPLRVAAKMRDPAEYEYFEHSVKPLLGGDVEFVGEVSAQQKYELLGDAIALLNPIDWDEPFGMVMVESMATGTPVVTTPRGAAPEIIQDGVTGFLRETDVELAEAAVAAASLTRAHIRRHVERHFSTTDMVLGYLELYRLWSAACARAAAMDRPVSPEREDEADGMAPEAVSS